MPESASGFGDLLRDFRVRAGLSQSELAEKANISASAVGAIERGARKAPYRSTVSLLAKALQLDAGETAALQAARTAARAAPTNTAHNLITDRTSLVGRDEDLDQILRLLRRSRIVSVTGSGGIGKTRVVLEAARRAAGDLFHEVWFVDLGPLIDGDFITSKIANSIRPPIGDRADTIENLAAALVQRQMLLIFDNCEHLVERAAQAAEVLLETCSRASILATSRERLNVAGEYVYRLPSLTLEPAIELFSQRANEADPRVSFDAKTLPAVTDIARRLGGIPLALELTAALVPKLGLEALRAQLHEYLSVSPGRPGLPARQHTVMATIEWSYNLLAPTEQKLLCDVSVFAGGFTLAGAEAVCGGEAVDRSHVLPRLSSLANKSLLTLYEGRDRIRYALLESVRSFGLDRLRESGTYDSVVRRHARWFAAIADDVENTVSTLLPERAAELVPEFDNVRAAVAWSLNAPDRDDVAFACRILSGLYGLWDHLGRPREHRAWLEAALERVDEERYPVVTAYVLRDLMTRSQAELAVLERTDRTVLIAERSGDQIALVKILNVVCQVQAVHGMLEEAERSGLRAYELVIGNGLEHTHHYCENLLSRSFIRFMQRKIDDARALV
ncbi:MAG: helix-turn-helix domain-containing protein, partial [Candidatus Cybelea sp.]